MSTVKRRNAIWMLTVAMATTETMSEQRNSEKDDEVSSYLFVVWEV